MKEVTMDGIFVSFSTALSLVTWAFFILRDWIRQPPQNKRIVKWRRKKMMNETAAVSKVNVRKITVTAMLGALATILMFFEFSVPFIMPGFIKMDFSELPALIAAFSMGPVSGIAVCFIKNIVNLLHTTSGGVGEISNFILGVCFVLPAGLIYKKNKSQKGALIGALTGAVIMAVVSVFSNYFIVYPVYENFMPMEAIIGAYQAINHIVRNLWDALIWFNMPFTFVKGMFSVVITFLVYKRISPILKGKH